MTNFYSFHGTVTLIRGFFISPNDADAGCYKLFTLENESGQIVNFIVSPDTYFVDHETVTVGDRVTGYYDGDAPVILIYPPQYPALVMVKENSNQSVKVDYFNSQLLSSDGQLRLNISPNTRIFLTNGQLFTGNLANRDLVVVYGASTKSIPAQTTPNKIIVLC
ncbi:hypothetical protein GCM10010978_29240 [Compostibacillus humi]|uniref:Uncharacterized protein n=1 Tax=Compostibacillus humi TaxID=1245525 RepID=A0A8J2TTC5_9BACI|nr:hypothetical protein [Compostibacillus humi]GFZ87605.1 hypothetical protein GCM10010978_29240 [Compostibacillus humi]